MQKTPFVETKGAFCLAPPVRLELTTLRLTAECSAIELRRNRWRGIEPLRLGSGGDLCSRAVSSQVLSALKGLTSVFGMGTGGTPSPLPPEIMSLYRAYSLSSEPPVFQTQGLPQALLGPQRVLLFHNPANRVRFCAP